MLLVSGNAIAQDTEPTEAATGRAATEVELQNLDTAMALALLDTGVYHTLENLNDLPPGTTTSHPFDDIDEAGAGTAVLLPSTGRFAPARRDYANGGGLPWRGPYANYQPGRIELGAPVDYDEGNPLDQWAGPYRLYSPLGLVDPVNETIVLDAIGDRFDRWAIHTAGPDATLDTADDVWRLFGGAPTATVVSSVVVTPLPRFPGQQAEAEVVDGAALPRGTIGATRGTAPSHSPRTISATSRDSAPDRTTATLLVRGYNFGATQGTTQLFLDDVDLGEADSWTSRAILVSTSSTTHGRTLRIVRSGHEIDRFELR